MIVADTENTKRKAVKVKKRQTYSDAVVIIVVIAILAFSKINFNTFNVFKATWGYFGVANNTLKLYKLNNDTYILMENQREPYLQSLTGTDKENGWTLVRDENNYLEFTKGDVTRTYTFKSKSLLAHPYILVVRSEESNQLKIK